MDTSRAGLREQALHRRRSLTHDLRERKSLEILENLWKCPEITWANEWCVYLGVKDEVQTRSLVEALWRQNKNVTLPKRINEEYWPVLVKENLQTQTVVGGYGTLEPREDIPFTGMIDVWVIPGVAFDIQGHRLGYGLGYYDRMLAGQSGLKVGLSFEIQIIPEFPPRDEDLLLDFVITEDRVIRCQK